VIGDPRLRYDAFRGIALVVVTLFGLAMPPRAAEAAPALTIQATLERPHVAVGEEGQVTIIAEARGVTLPEFAFPSVPGLHAVRVADSQNFSWMNGKLSRSSTSVFLVSASAPGRYTIPSIRIASGSARAETQPLVLEVGGPGAPPMPGTPGNVTPPRVWGDESLPELFVRLVVDRRRAYWNQQVTARFVLYSREHLEELPLWQVTEASGFWKESLGEMKRGRVRIGNADYVAYEQDVAYFPTRAGTLKLGPGRVEARILRRMEQPDPWSFLGLPETRVETIPLQTESAAVAVLPLPGGAPAGFQGAVGQLALDVKVDRFTARAGEPVTVVTILRGRGNLTTAGDPDLSATLPLRSFESPGTVSATVDGLRVRGERRHEKAFVPEVPGMFAIEPIRFTWFDPEEGRYRSQVSDSIRIRVVAGGDSTLAMERPTDPPAAPRSRTGPRGSLDPGPPIGAAAVGAVSLAALAGAALAAGVRRRALLDPKQRRREALRALARSLERLRASESASASGRAAGIVLEALAQRYEVDLEGRSREESLRLARASGASEETVATARRLLEELEALAFAPARSGADAGVLASAQSFVERLQT